MKSHQQAVLSALFALIGFVSAVPDNVFIETKTFGSYEFHEDPTLDDVTTAGLVVGWVLFGVTVIVSGILIIKDTCDRHSEYKSKVASAQSRMRELGLSVEDADREFEKRRKGIKEGDEDDQLAEAALKQENKA